MPNGIASPAEQAAQEALERLFACLDEHRNFLLEAGAGAGKTYSLVQALRYLIENRATDLARKHQQIACITYTNVAADEIVSRTDSHPVVHASTIHAFCWSFIKAFQPQLRPLVPSLKNWEGRLNEAEVEADQIAPRTVEYDFGYPSINDTKVLLHHDDVIELTVKLMDNPKFRSLFVDRYPIIFVDEYQDTNKDFADSLVNHFIAERTGPLIGFFGDHWQQIYRHTCGKIEHAELEVIDKQANFRSVQRVVDCLNLIRPELTQFVDDTETEGYAAVFHSNNWVGQRQTGPHNGGDLPPDVADRYLQALIDRLTQEGWDFSPEKAKILMLTHNVIADKQGYRNLANVFPNKDALIKKEDAHIAFLADMLEPVCEAFENRRYGEMFSVLDKRTPTIRSHADKEAWSADLNALNALRADGTIGEVLDHLKATQRPRVSSAVERRERDLEELNRNPVEEEPSSITRLRALRDIPYAELRACAKFIDDKTPFSTKHGVKGAEFENVLVVFGRGWNLYNFNQYLELAADPTNVPAARREMYERNRNLFYVCCSRPKRRLALLFTQELSAAALETLSGWFGADAISALEV